MDIQNKRIPDGEFAALRQEVLSQWPTGRGVDLEEAVAYHKAMPDERIFAKKLLAAKAAGRTLVQPRAGVPVISEHIKLMQHLQDQGEADLLPTTIDSYTRQNRYEEAENGIPASWWLRTPDTGYLSCTFGIGPDGRIGSGNANASNGVRPAFWLPSNLSVSRSDQLIQGEEVFTLANDP